jgi:hypothetical protein
MSSDSPTIDPTPTPPAPPADPTTTPVKPAGPVRRRPLEQHGGQRPQVPVEHQDDEYWNNEGKYPHQT